MSNPLTAADLPHICLDTQPDPDDLPIRIGPKHPQLPFVILVAADAIARPDPRPVEDRRPIPFTRDTFDKAMANLGLVVDLALPIPGTPRITLRFQRLADLNPGPLAAQLAERALLDPLAAQPLLGPVYADPRVTQIERLFRGLRLLVDQAGPHAAVELLNLGAVDLDEDLSDAPTLPKSGLSRIVNAYNHLGMRPFGALILPDDLAPRAHRLRDIAAIARDAHLAVIAAAGDADPFPGYPAWRQTDDARFVARVRDHIILAPAGPSRPSRAASGAFAVAALMLQSHARTRAACLFAAPDAILPGLPVVAAHPRDPEDGLLTLTDGARIARDDTCHAGADRSLAVLNLGNRILHEALNVQWRRGLRAHTPIPDLVAGTNAGLANRLRPSGIHATVAPAASDLELTIRLPGAGALTRRLPLPSPWW